MYSLGIDIGSTQTKGVLLHKGEIVNKCIINAGTGSLSSKKIIDKMFENDNFKRRDVAIIVTTGYGRNNFAESNLQISELTAHSIGVCNCIENVGTIIDIGGQDVKVMEIQDNRLKNFVMNDKCAAGTGRFLDMMARIFEVDVSELASLAQNSTENIRISSICTVFAESEIISHLSNGKKIKDICNGLHHSVAQRAAGLSGRLFLSGKIVMSGGVAKNQSVVDWLSKEMKQDIVVPEDCEFMGALGAAIYGDKELRKENDGKKS